MQPNPVTARAERLACAIAALVVIALGLAWRLPILHWPPEVKKYGADALWAVLVFLLIRFLRPSWPVWKSAAAAFAFSVAIEFSQLYHAPWIDAIRATRPGALVLGSAFNVPDIAAYTIGIIGAVLLRTAFGGKWKSATP